MRPPRNISDPVQLVVAIIGTIAGNSVDNAILSDDDARLRLYLIAQACELLTTDNTPPIT